MTTADRQKPGAKPGNQNAAKDDGATSYIHARCTPADKARWVHAAQAEGLKLTEWITKTLNAEEKQRKRVVFLPEIQSPPDGFVKVPADLCRHNPGFVAYFNWPIAPDFLADAIRHPNGAAAMEIRNLIF